MATDEENFRKILGIISPIFIAINNDLYPNIDYRIMSIKTFTKELRAIVNVPKALANYGTIELVYLAGENKIKFFTSSIEAVRFTETIADALIEEKFECEIHLNPVKPPKGEIK